MHQELSWGMCYLWQLEIPQQAPCYITCCIAYGNKERLHEMLCKVPTMEKLEVQTMMAQANTRNTSVHQKSKILLLWAESNCEAASPQGLHKIQLTDIELNKPSVATVSY